MKFSPWKRKDPTHPRQIQKKGFLEEEKPKTVEVTLCRVERTTPVHREREWFARCAQQTTYREQQQILPFDTDPRPSVTSFGFTSMTLSIYCCLFLFLLTESFRAHAQKWNTHQHSNRYSVVHNRLFRNYGHCFPRQKSMQGIQIKSYCLTGFLFMSGHHLSSFVLLFFNLKLLKIDPHGNIAVQLHFD